jgi:hypothetical protein
VIVLFEFDVHPLGRSVFSAVVPVRLAQSDAEPLRLVQFCGRQQKQHFSAEAWFGTTPVQVAREHRPVDETTRPDRVGLQAAEEYFPGG